MWVGYWDLFSELSPYWTQHIWETIAAALGHAQHSTTDVYIRFDRRKVDDANRRVIDWVNGGEFVNKKY